MSDEPEVEELFREWVRLRKQGKKPRLEDLCADCPELVDQVRERIRPLEKRIRAKRRQQESTRSFATDGESAVNKPLIQIDGYTILREIGRGGQGIIFKALQTSTGRHVAVKVLTEARQLSDTERTRFDREAQVLAALEHPHIVSILDRGHTAGGSSYFTMEHIDGLPLDKWLDDYRQEHPPPDIPSNPAELLRLFMKIADAVNVAHLRGIIHRDLKPSNILVDDRGDPHVLDFGLARLGLPSEVYSKQHRVVTMTGQFLGTLPWVSPEQAEGLTSKIDTRTDVYSLGVVLYEMLTGEFPYEVVGNMRDVLDNILRAQPKPPSTVIEARLVKEAEKRKRWRKKHRNPITQDLEAIVLKALNKKPENRYQNAGELARDIGSYLSGRPIEATNFSRVSPKRNLRWIAAATFVAVVVGIFAGIWIRDFHRSAEPGSDMRSDLPEVVPPSQDSSGSKSIGPETSLDTPNIRQQAQRDVLTLSQEASEPSLPRLQPGQPISRSAIVSMPAKLPGVESWTIETTFSRGENHTVLYDPLERYIAVVNGDGATRLYDPSPDNS